MQRDDSRNRQRDARARLSPRVIRVLPLALLLLLALAVLLSDLRGLLTLETVVRHRAALAAFIEARQFAAYALYIAVYVAVVALSIPGAAALTMAGGFLFGTVFGAVAAILGATGGAVLIFLVARTAFGETLARRAGPRIARLAAGFRADAFSYLLFLRLVPAFPFWLVNLAAALFAVPLRVFVLATAIGIVPGAFVFAFAGAGLDSVIAAQALLYRDCLAAGRPDCRLDFDPHNVLTPQLLGALAALGALALVPVVVRRWRLRRGAAGSDGWGGA